MINTWQGRGISGWKVNLRDINGLVIVAAVLAATIIMAGASEAKLQRLADEMAKITKLEKPTPIKLAHCPVGDHSGHSLIR